MSQSMVFCQEWAQVCPPGVLKTQCDKLTSRDDSIPCSELRNVTTDLKDISSILKSLDDKPISGRKVDFSSLVKNISKECNIPQQELTSRIMEESLAQLRTLKAEHNNLTLTVEDMAALTRDMNAVLLGYKENFAEQKKNLSVILQIVKLKNPPSEEDFENLKRMLDSLIMKDTLKDDNEWFLDPTYVVFTNTVLSIILILLSVCHICRKPAVKKFTETQTQTSDSVFGWSLGSPDDQPVQ